MRWWFSRVSFAVMLDRVVLTTLTPSSILLTSRRSRPTNAINQLTILKFKMYSIHQKNYTVLRNQQIFMQKLLNQKWYKLKCPPSIQLGSFHRESPVSARDVELAVLALLPSKCKVYSKQVIYSYVKHWEGNSILERICYHTS